jgi:hypothetical protein
MFIFVARLCANFVISPRSRIIARLRILCRPATVGQIAIYSRLLASRLYR